jgi:hypothetical protein
VRYGASADGDHNSAFGKRRQEVVVARGESFRQKTPRYRMSALKGQLRGWQTGTYLSRHTSLMSGRFVEPVNMRIIRNRVR